MENFFFFKILFALIVVVVSNCAFFYAIACFLRFAHKRKLISRPPHSTLYKAHFNATQRKIIARRRELN